MPVRQVEDGHGGRAGPRLRHPPRPRADDPRRPASTSGRELGGPRAANRPVDDFFKSLAEEQRERAICIIMSGMGSNGTAGAQAIKAVGGLCIAQDPEIGAVPVACRGT